MEKATAATSSTLRIIAIAAISCACLYAILTVADYSKCVQDAEVVLWAKNAFQAGPRFSFGDFKSALFPDNIEFIYSRSRYLSYLCSMELVKFRHAIWGWLPPHPSFSPLWLITLLWAPWLFYKCLKMMFVSVGQDLSRELALIGTSVYVLSVGYLSSATLFFHPAKPLANVALIISFYMAATIQKSHPVSGRPSENLILPRWTIAFILTVLPFMLLFDETVLFCLTVIPVWHWRFFIPVKKRWASVKPCLLNAAIISFPLFFFLFFVFAFKPLLCEWLFKQTYSFSGYLAEYVVPGWLNPARLLRHAVTLLCPTLLPWPMTHLTIPVSYAPEFTGDWLILPLAIIFGWLGQIVCRHKKYWHVFIKTIILAVIFLVFETNVAAHHNLNLVLSGYYYGAMFSVLFAILAACIFGSLVDQPGYGLVYASLFIVYILTIQAVNFIALDRSWIRHNSAKAMNLIGSNARCFQSDPLLGAADYSAILTLYNSWDKTTMLSDDIPDAAWRKPAERILALWKTRDENPAGYLRQTAGPLALGEFWALMELNNYLRIR